jgi:hypothetical protein
VTPGSLCCRRAHDRWLATECALLDYQHALQIDYTGTVAVVEAEAAALIDGG